ncbi:MAG: hypothetical protein AB1758_00030 [Candidatus Eremiobacterota bacterium]
MRAYLLLLVCLVQAAWGQPPPLLEVTPAEGSSIQDHRPVISINLTEDVEYATARLWVNKQEVTLTTLRTPTFVSYRPMDDLSGTVEVRFWARNRSGAGVDRKWSFVVQPGQRIVSVKHDAVEKLGEYDELNVELRGEPGGQAWFDLEDYREKIPLQEVSEGVYRGSYLVHPGEYRLSTTVVGYLKFGGVTERMACDRKVKIFANVFQVRIISPPSGTQVDGSVTIRGRTRPNAQVVAVVRVAFQDNVPPPRSDKDEADGLERGQADEKGFFTIEYGPPVILPNMQVVMAIFAVDEEGNRSVPAIVRYRL